MRLGEHLLADGHITESALHRALDEQRRSGGRLGAILAASHRLHPLTLLKTLGRQSHTATVDLQAQPPESTVLQLADVPDYIFHQAIPYRRDGHLITLACAERSPALTRWATARYGENVAYVLTTPRDIRTALAARFGAALDEQSRTHLLTHQPESSAARTLYPGQMRWLAALLLVVAAALAWLPWLAIPIGLTLINLFYIGTIGLKCLLYLYAPAAPARAPQEAIPESSLPVYTILIPLYREAASIPRLLAAMRALDYPKTRLDIKLVVEADDEPTIAAITAARPEPYFDLIRVPYSIPRTKPKACDYALRFARGEYVTIYDAEDQPEPDQLRSAVAMFRRLPESVVCLQARLNYYNWPENLLTRLFAIEYASLFDVMLPGLERLRLPIPLGGTSNHFALTTLRALGEWDPYNVTEDADLGMRLARAGYETRMLDSLTLEESPIHLRAWMHQRARWIKGYMQTWLVMMRRPVHFYRRAGAAAFWSTQFFIGGPCAVFLLSPLLWGITIAWLGGWLPAVALPGWLIALCLINLIAGILVHLWIARVAVRRWRWPGMALAMALYPFYWLLHSAASYRALWQLIRQPHRWDKTVHGLTRLAGMTPAPSPHR